MTKSRQTVSDNHVYQGLEFKIETLKYYLDAFCSYKKQLEEEISLLKEDDFLSQLLGEEALNQTHWAQELGRVNRFIEAFQRKIDGPSDWISLSETPVDFGFRELSLRHRDIRYIKSITDLYWQHLKARRDMLIRSRRISKAMLQTIDAEMSRRAENSKGGVFENVELISLLVSFPEPNLQHEETSVLQESTRLSPSPLPTPIYGLQILDLELRERCQDLLEQFSEPLDNQRLDTVISEATRVLENRIRSLSGVDQNTKDPVGAAFGGKDPVVKLSDHEKERQGAVLLFKGTFQFIRNPFHHKIIPIDRERVIQLLGLVDYLLYLVDNAGRTETSRKTEES